MKTTPAENQVVMEGTIAYYGTYTVGETGKTVSLRVEASSFPNHVGSEQKRTITSLTASELKLSNPTALTGGQIKATIGLLLSTQVGKETISNAKSCDLLHGGAPALCLGCA